MQHNTALRHNLSPVSLNAAEIAPLTHVEAMAMATEQTQRFLALLGSLSGSDWDQPTACTLWSVRDVVAHQAGHVRSFISLGEFFRQLRPGLLRPYREKNMDMLDAINQAQVDLRRGRSTSELIAEIRDLARTSINGRNRIPSVIRAFKPSLPGLEKGRSLGYLFDLVYTRDMWMHHIDICRATGRPILLDTAPDERTVALIVRDFAENIEPLIDGQSVILRLTRAGVASYQIGQQQENSTIVELDVLAFCLLTSGRITAESIAPEAVITGDFKLSTEILSLAYNRVLY